ncbi:MAG: hypothetical protein AAGL17_05790, partial [Cyanobacteria bacterium J06576_12]
MPFPEILTQARFYLELNLEGSVDTIDGYFLECGGFSRSQAVIEVSEVTPQVWGAQGRSRGHIVQSKITINIRACSAYFTTNNNLNACTNNWVFRLRIHHLSSKCL